MVFRLHKKFSFFKGRSLNLVEMLVFDSLVVREDLGISVGNQSLTMGVDKNEVLPTALLHFCPVVFINWLLFIPEHHIRAA